jgi:hypothetical protein
MFRGEGYQWQSDFGRGDQFLLCQEVFDGYGIALDEEILEKWRQIMV